MTDFVIGRAYDNIHKGITDSKEPNSEMSSISVSEAGSSYDKRAHNFFRKIGTEEGVDDRKFSAFNLIEGHDYDEHSAFNENDTSPILIHSNVYVS